MDKDEAFFIIDDSAVLLDGPEYEIDISGYHLFYREGIWMERNNAGEFEPDWGLTWFYENPDNPKDYFYYEQDPPGTAIHNLERIIKGR